ASDARPGAEVCGRPAEPDPTQAVRSRTTPGTTPSPMAGAGEPGRAGPPGSPRPGHPGRADPHSVESLLLRPSGCRSASSVTSATNAHRGVGPMRRPANTPPTGELSQ